MRQASHLQFFALHFFLDLLRCDPRRVKVYADFAGSDVVAEEFVRESPVPAADEVNASDPGAFFV